jgi:hypothetical protein
MSQVAIASTSTRPEELMIEVGHAHQGQRRKPRSAQAFRPGRKRPRQRVLDGRRSAPALPCGSPVLPSPEAGEL